VKTLIYSDKEDLLEGFKQGHAFNSTQSATYTQGEDDRGNWLLIEDKGPGDNQTYEISEQGLVHTDTGVEI
jgi:hypothetical protein